VLGEEPARALPGEASLRFRSAAARGARVLAAVLVLGGCANLSEVTGTATQQDYIQLRADVTALQASVRQMRAQVDSLGPQVDARLRSQVAELERQTSALTGRLDGLGTTLTTLTARLDELTAKLDALSRQLRAATPAAPARPPVASVPAPQPGPPPPAAAAPSPATPSTARPASPGVTPPSTAAPAMPAQPGASPSVPAPPGATPPAVAATPPPAPSAGARPSTGALQPQDLYQAAYIDFSKGTYTLAIAGFREFLRRYPEHPLASNAQYWIGEAQLAVARGHADGGQAEEATRALQQAVLEFRKVLANYPRGDKAPAALYKEALVLIELKQPELAQTRLQYLVDNFPQSEETPLARERLAALRDR